MADKRALQLEGVLANAHRLLWKAADLACEIGDEGAYEDLQAMYLHLEALTADLLRGRRRHSSR